MKILVVPILLTVACAGDDATTTDTPGLTVEERRARIREIQSADAGCTRVEQPPEGEAITTRFDAFGWPAYREVAGIRYEHTIEREADRIVRWTYDQPDGRRYVITFDEHEHLDGIAVTQGETTSGPFPYEIEHDEDGFRLSSTVDQGGRITVHTYDACERSITSTTDGELVSRVTPTYLPDSCLVSELLYERPVLGETTRILFEEGRPVRGIDVDDETRITTYAWTCP